MKKSILAVCLLLALVICTGCGGRAYEIPVVVPAGSTGQEVSWSDQEISSKKDWITFSAGKNLWDCAVSLLPTEAQEENAYDESLYLTPGVSAQMDVEKNGWFRVGVSAINDTGVDQTVYVKVEPVDVRIQ